MAGGTEGTPPGGAGGPGGPEMLHPPAPPRAFGRRRRPEGRVSFGKTRMKRVEGERHHRPATKATVLPPMKKTAYSSRKSTNLKGPTEGAAHKTRKPCEREHENGAPAAVKTPDTGGEARLRGGPPPAPPRAFGRWRGPEGGASLGKTRKKRAEGRAASVLERRPRGCHRREKQQIARERARN